MHPPDLKPSDRAEEIAIFRATLLGPVLLRDLAHGQLANELRVLSEARYRPPGAASTRTYQVPTLERWLYAYRARGLAGLRPEPRSDRGFAQELSEELRELLLAIRREHPSASVSLILATLTEEGYFEKSKVSEPTVRRLFAAAGLARRAKRGEGGTKTRLRWQAEHPGALWHGDVCHVTTCKVAGKLTPLRIHGMLDDASRYVVALEAHTTEKEVDMLGMLVDALRRWGKPDALYLDNGSTYRGDVLKTACARLAITLLHAKPYDPQARGKMERFWRTLRDGLLNYLGDVASLAEINRQLQAFLDKRYHVRPHSSLLGKSPAKVYATRDGGEGAINEAAFRLALTERTRRHVSGDNVISFDGIAYELDQGFLAGKNVTVAQCFVTPDEPPWVEHEGKRLVLRVLDPIKNARRKRPPRVEDAKPTRRTGFNPSAALLGAPKKDDPGSEGDSP
jgi:putative transposase